VRRGIALVVDRDQVGRVRLGAGRGVEGVEEDECPLGLRATAENRHALERERNPCEAGAGEEAGAGVGRLNGLRPRRLVLTEIPSGDESPAFLEQLDQRRRDRAPVHARSTLLGQELERTDEPRLLEQLAGPEEPAARRVDTRAFAHRHHGLEHLEAGDVCRRHRHSLLCQSQRRGAEVTPGEPSVLAPERVQPGGDVRGLAHRPTLPLVLLVL